MAATELQRRAIHIVHSTSVKQSCRPEQIEKPYGTIYRHHLVVDVPDALFGETVMELEETRYLQKVQRAATPGFVVLMSLFGFMLMVKLDRLTRGYHRPAIVFGAVLGISSVVAGAVMIF
ncbi:hypothetical protein OAJ60_04960 [Planctomycetaceae bacterium]|nr:hypothetical protein [Planctomycetaceae bacterium]